MPRVDEPQAGPDGWTDWIQPVRRGYRLICCDCGLAHTLDFRVIGRGTVQFRVRRNNRSTAAVRRHMSTDAASGHGCAVKEIRR